MWENAGRSASATTAIDHTEPESLCLQTVVNIASALAVAGKSVLVVAKMPVALGVFVNKLHRACGSDGVRVLSSAGFMAGKAESKVRQVGRFLFVSLHSAPPKPTVHVDLWSACIPVGGRRFEPSHQPRIAE
jgi:hypothetical protein